MLAERKKSWAQSRLVLLPLLAGVASVSKGAAAPVGAAPTGGTVIVVAQV